MKALLAIILFCCSISGFGQDPDLFRTWYLTEMTADLGDSFFVDDVIPSIAPNLTIESNLTYQGTMHCNEFGGAFDYDATENILTINEFNRTFLFCSSTSHENFEALFAQYFMTSNEYTFTITESNGVFYLDLLSLSVQGFDLRYQSVALPIYLPDPELLATTWYLQDLVLDGNSYVPNYIGQHLDLSFAEEGNGDYFLNFNHDYGMCSYAMGFFENNQFKYFNGICLTLGICNSQACLDYFIRYRPFYEDYFNTKMDYAISFEPDGSKSLIVTNVDGDQAFYSTNQIVLGMEENKVNAIVVYPNPATSALYIKTEMVNIESVTIYAVTGHRILFSNTVDASIDISSLASGIYFLEVISNQGRDVLRFIKN